MKFKEKQNFFNLKKIVFLTFFFLVFFINTLEARAAKPSDWQGTEAQWNTWVQAGDVFGENKGNEEGMTAYWNNMNYNSKYDINRENTEANIPVDKTIERESDNGECGVINGTIENCIEQIEYSILVVFSWIMGIFVALFEQVLQFTVVHITDTLDALPVINTIWGILRDIANMTLIFVILFIAINTIIGRSDHGIKQALSKVIFVAVLINFSMFFGKVIVDTGNILSLQFYQKITENNGGQGLANIMLTALKPQQFFDEKKGVPGNLADTYLENVPTWVKYGFLLPLTGVAHLLSSKVTPAQQFAAQPNASTIFFMGIITMFITACVFLSASIIFIKRLITIILLLTSSSIAFAGMITHKTERMSHEWWERLIKESFYAPIFMGVMWIAVLVMNSAGFRDGITREGGKSILFGFIAAGTIVSFIFVINLFILALTLGEKIGVAGSEGAMKTFGWLKTNLGARPLQAGVVRPIGNWAYRHLEGKDGRHKINDMITRWKTGKHGAPKKWLGDLGHSVLHGLATAKLAGGAAGKSSIEMGKDIEQAIAAREFEIKNDSKAVADLYVEMSVRGREKNDLNATRGFEHSVEKKSSRELANMIAVMQNTAKTNREKAEKETNQTKKSALLLEAKQNEDTAEHIKRRMDDNKMDEIERASEKDLPFHRDKVKDMLEGVSPGHGAPREGGIQQMAEYQEIYGPDSALIKGIKADEKAFEELRKIGQEGSDAGRALKGSLKAKTDLLKQKEIDFLQLPQIQQLRYYVGSLNSTQFGGLNPKQLISPAIVDMVKGKMISQLDNGGRLNTDELELISRRAVQPRVGRLIEYTKAIESKNASEKNESRQVILRETNKHLTSRGESIIKTGDDNKDEEMALDIYERELMPEDSATSSSERNFSRSTYTGFGGEGEKINKNAYEAKERRKLSAQNNQPNTPQAPNNPAQNNQPANPPPAGYKVNAGGSLLMPDDFLQPPAQNNKPNTPPPPTGPQITIDMFGSIT